MKKIFAIVLTALLMISMFGCAKTVYEPEELAFPIIEKEKVPFKNVTDAAPPVQKEQKPTDPDTVPMQKEQPPIKNEEQIPPVTESVTVPILMFHDVKTVPGGEWSMSAENFRNTLQFLKDSGYTAISFDTLVEYVDGTADMPERPVCITLDDGYFSNYRNVLPIVTELQTPVTVFMVCNTVREKGTVPPADESTLYKMSAAELEIMDCSPYVDIQSHTYDLHGQNTSYSDIERDFSLPLEGETEQQFKRIYTKDCIAADRVLNEIGERKYKILSYPGGKYHEWIEQVLYEQNYRVTVTSDDWHINTVTKGDPNSLFLLGRLNVNDATTKERLLKYLEQR